MKRLSVILLLLLASLALSCGSSSRHLQSITITATATNIGGQYQLVGTGHFSSPPTTVTPLPVFWQIDLPPGQYTLTTQPYMAQCSPVQPGPIIALAPADPNAPSSGPIAGTNLISQSWACTDVGQ